MDRRKESFELLNEKVTLTPIQLSLLMRLAGGSFSPYLLGGPGWYRRSVEVIEGSDLKVSTQEFGWHAGIGLEIRAGKHLGIHGDYRYTFLDFGEDDDDDEGDHRPVHSRSQGLDVDAGIDGLFLGLTKSAPVSEDGAPGDRRNAARTRVRSGPGPRRSCAARRPLRGQRRCASDD